MKNKTFIIAEAGVNHNGLLKNALKLVEVAKIAGADAIKFQTYKTSKLLTNNATVCKYQRIDNKVKNQKQILAPLELKEKDFIKISKYCKKKNIEFMSTAFDTDSLDFLKKVTKIKRVKVPSGEMINPFILLKAAKTKLPIILSTGLADINEIKQALAIIAFGMNAQKKLPNANDLKKYINIKKSKFLSKKLTILHCISDYPAKKHETNLMAMLNLGNRFGIPFGLSDHSQGYEISIAAVAMGATVIEKHITLNRNMKGPDHKASLSQSQFKDMVKCIRAVEQALGDGIKKPSKNELINKKYIRGSLVASKKINKGQTFSEKNITVKRPGDGINPLDFIKINGKVSNYNFLKDDKIKK